LTEEEGRCFVCFSLETDAEVAVSLIALSLTAAGLIGANGRMDGFSLVFNRFFSSALRLNGCWLFSLYPPMVYRVLAAAWWTLVPYQLMKRLLAVRKMSTVSFLALSRLSCSLILSDLI